MTRLVSYPHDTTVINTGLGKQSEFSKSGFLLKGSGSMIEIKDLSKTFSSASGTVEALRDINLTINDG